MGGGIYGEKGREILMEISTDRQSNKTSLLVNMGLTRENVFLKTLNAK